LAQSAIASKLKPDVILSGEREPEKLAELRDHRCKETEAAIAAALVGNYQEEHLFKLGFHSRCSILIQQGFENSNLLAKSS
jgi:hypothetical protein